MIKIFNLFQAAFNGYQFTPNDVLIDVKQPIEVRKNALKEFIRDFATYNPNELECIGMNGDDVKNACVDIDDLTLTDFNNLIRLVLTCWIPLPRLWEITKR
jgi:hypothetical protein